MEKGEWAQKERRKAGECQQTAQMVIIGLLWLPFSFSAFPFTLTVKEHKPIVLSSTVNQRETNKYKMAAIKRRMQAHKKFENGTFCSESFN